MFNRRKGQAGIAAAVVRLFAIGGIATSIGCTDEACFSWSKAEGACPSQEQALQFFVPVGCTGAIESVDSDGEFVVDNEDPFSGDLCCYTVTESENEFGNFCSGQPPF